MANTNLKVPVKDNRLAEVLAGVLVVYPRDPDFQGTDQDWVEKVLKNYLIELFKAGKNIQTAQQNKLDENI